MKRLGFLSDVTVVTRGVGVIGDNNLHLGRRDTMSTTLSKLGDDGSRQAVELIARAIEIVAAHDKARPEAEGARLFFPEGIDMISVKFKLGTAVDISVAISGKSCCKSAGLSDSARASSGGGVSAARSLSTGRTVLTMNAARRSVEGDATDCLIEAVGATFNIEVGPEELADLKPADVGAQDHVKWLSCLNRAAKCLRRKGYSIEDFQSAEDLFGKVLDASLGALIDRIQI